MNGLYLLVISCPFVDCLQQLKLWVQVSHFPSLLCAVPSLWLICTLGIHMIFAPLAFLFVSNNACLNSQDITACTKPSLVTKMSLSFNSNYNYRGAMTNNSFPEWSFYFWWKNISNSLGTLHHSICNLEVCTCYTKAIVDLNAECILDNNFSLSPQWKVIQSSQWSILLSSPWQPNNLFQHLWSPSCCQEQSFEDGQYILW